MRDVSSANRIIPGGFDILNASGTDSQGDLDSPFQKSLILPHGIWQEHIAPARREWYRPFNTNLLVHGLEVVIFGVRVDQSMSQPSRDLP